jgi:ABC-type lipoprotein release transport system permease subunit
MNTSLLIARRYLFAKKKRNAINIISSIAVLAFTVCTAALIIVLSTMNGFENLIFSMYSRFNPDLKISPVSGKVFDGHQWMSKLKAVEGVSAVWPILEDKAAIRNGDYQTICTVKGIDSNYLKGNGLTALITEGDGIVREQGINYIVMGAGIQQKINAGLGGPFSMVSLITPKRGNYTVSDPNAINMMQLEPVGAITLDESISNKYVFVPIQFSQELFQRGDQISGIEIRFKPGVNSDKAEQTIRSLMGSSFKVQNRLEQQATLYKMFKSEKWASFAILTFILLIAAFNALGSLTMLVIEKKEDIKTLLGIGARPSLIQKVFFINGFLISGLGAFVGLLIGVVLVLLQQNYGLVKMQGAIVDSYPVKLMLSDVLVVAITTLFLGFITGIYPALKSVKGGK